MSQIMGLLFVGEDFPKSHHVWAPVIAGTAFVQ